MSYSPFTPENSDSHHGREFLSHIDTVTVENHCSSFSKLYRSREGRLGCQSGLVSIPEETSTKISYWGEVIESYKMPFLKSLPDNTRKILQYQTETGFPSGSVVKNPPASSGDTSSIPGPGRSPRGGSGNSLQCSRLGNPRTEDPGRYNL